MRISKKPPPSLDSAVRYTPLLSLNKLRTFQFRRDYLLALLLILAALVLSLAFLRLWPIESDTGNTRNSSSDRLWSLSRP